MKKRNINSDLIRACEIALGYLCQDNSNCKEKDYRFISEAVNRAKKQNAASVGRNVSPSEPAGRAGSVEAEAKSESVSATPEEK